MKRDTINTLKNQVMKDLHTRMLASQGRHAVRELDYNSRQAVILQYRLMTDLLQKNKDTEYGRLYGFADIHSVEEFKEKVPFTTYDNYEPYIRRMQKGEENLLTADPPVHYAISSGSVGVPKYVPVTEKELEKFVKYSAVMAFGVADEYYRDTTGKGTPPGPGLNAIEMKVVKTETGIDKGAISGRLMHSMKSYVPFLLSSSWDVVQPEGEMDMKYLKSFFALKCRDLAFMDSAFMTGLVDLMDYIRKNYRMLCRDIWNGRINEDIKMPDDIRRSLGAELRPDKARAKELMREFQQGFDTPIIPRIWPRMSWIGGIGTGGFFSYARRMRRYSGKSIPFNNVCYAASECFIAAARHMGDESFVLIPDGGFYEFIPARVEAVTRTLTIEELEVGEDYEIIITNLSGFYRYRLQDVVRVTGYYNEAPLIRFIYRKDQLLSIGGEKTNEETMRWTIEQFSLECSVVVNDYSLYADLSTSPAHYVVLIEPDQIVPAQDIRLCRDVLEKKLMQANPIYGDMIRNGTLGQLEIVFLQQQTYQLYRDLMTMKGYSANQLKPVRVIDTPMKEKFFFGLKENYEDFI